jgi:transketolase
MSAAWQQPVPMRFVGIKDTFAESGTPEGLLQKYGLTAADIVAAVRDLLGQKTTAHPGSRRA